MHQHLCLNLPFAMLNGNLQELYNYPDSTNGWLMWYWEGSST